MSRTVEVTVKDKDYLRMRRITRGKTLEDVAKVAGCSIAYISLIETGKRNLTDSIARKIAKCYGLSFGEMKEFFIFGSDE